MMRYKITKATKLDVDGIHHVENECFTTPWSRDMIYSDVVNSPITHYYTVKNTQDEIIGFGGIYNVIGEAHIANIGVLQQYRNSGLGSMLLSTLINKARSLNCLGITLEVRVSNHNAIRLYEKFGFFKEGIRKNYYRDIVEDADIMWLFFSS